MLETYEKHAKTKLIATVVAVLVIAGFVFVSDHLKSQNITASTTSQATTSSTPAATTTSQTAATPTTTTSSSASMTAATSTKYTDGTYTASSDYYVPHGEEAITVSLTITSGVISNASIQNSENDFDSARYQEDFASAYKNYVVGKQISGLKLSVISGASDTTQGFNDALSQIASKAQA